MTWSSVPSQYPDTSPSRVPSTVPMITDASPTVSDTRAPYTIRLSTSRPSGSVPNGNAAVGACMRIGNPRSFRLNSYGSRGASTGARMATTTSPRMIIALTAPSGLRRTSRHTAPHTPHSAKGAPSPPCDTAAGAASAVTDSGIKPGVAQVDEQVRHHDHRGEEQHGALDQGVVAQQDGVEHQAADARLQEDELHDHGAPEQHRELLADDRHDRDERVLQRVPHDHGALAHTLGARRADVILPQHLEQRRTRHPHRHRRQPRPDDEGRDEELAQAARGVLPERGEADGRDPLGPEREERDGHRGEPEVRERQAQDGEEAAQVVARGVLFDRGENADR